MGIDKCIRARGHKPFPDSLSRLLVDPVQPGSALHEVAHGDIERGLADLLGDDPPDLVRVRPIEPADLSYDLENLLLIDDLATGMSSDTICDRVKALGLSSSVLDVAVLGSSSREQRTRP